MNIATDLINAFPGNSSVNTNRTIQEAVFSIYPTDASTDWLDSVHVICVSCDSCPSLAEPQINIATDLINAFPDNSSVNTNTEQ
jgi:hypothetical protein